jgi:uncharacterized membrane protein YqhA
MSPRRKRWVLAGVVFGAFVALCGLVVVALAIAFASGMNAWATNK